MHRFIYSSLSEAPLDEKDLDLLLGSARRHNEADALTGILIHVRTENPAHSGFVQLLEGDRGAIERTYGRILRDDLHTDLHVLVEEPAAGRIFPNWSMRLERVTQESDELLDVIRDVDLMQTLVYSYPG